MDVSKKLVLLFALVALVGGLGKMANPRLQLYTLDDDLLIMRQGQSERNQVVRYVLSEMPSQAATLSHPSQADDRAPASIAPSAASLGNKRKVRTLLAAIERPQLNTPLETAALRQRQVSVDSEGMFNLLSELHQQNLELQQVEVGDRSFELNLFKDSSFQAIIDSVIPSSQGGFVTKGHLANLSGSQFTLIQEGDLILANIQAKPELQYEMRFAGGAHVISQLDPYLLSASAPPPTPSFRTRQGRGKIVVAYTPSLGAAQGGPSAIKTLGQLALADAMSGTIFSLKDIASSLDKLELVELPSDDLSQVTQELINLAVHIGAEQVHILTQGNTKITAQ